MRDKAYYRQYYADNKERIAARRRKYYVQNKEKIVARTKRWQEANVDKVAWLKRARHLKVKYNITLDEYNFLYYSQGGCCKICGKKCKVLAVDHNHKTGTVRGLLCKPCNLVLGNADENVQILRKAIQYLTEENNHASY